MFHKFYLLSLFLIQTNAFRFSSWYVGRYNQKIYPVDWNIYTHVHYGTPSVDENGFAICDPYISRIPKENGGKILWGIGALDIKSVLWKDNRKLRHNYLKSIRKAMNDCDIDGIEVDYEFSDRIEFSGIVYHNDSTTYSQFLADLKKAVGPNKTVAADVSIWGIGSGEWLLGFFPWINVTMLNNGDFDYINTMSYHWSKYGNLWAWKKDAFFIDLWGIDRSRVNIGIPYYSTEFWLQKSEEPSWNGLSEKCPNIAYNQNTCNGIVFVGKKMNYELGKWIKNEGFGGVFPWALNYDSNKYNNSLIKWLYKGVNDG
ncbi:glycoside hydrolase family 18 protein [Aureispira]|nr:glycoside hydrolase family 18 protein [Aureispira sp.]